MTESLKERIHANIFAIRAAGISLLTERGVPAKEHEVWAAAADEAQCAIYSVINRLGLSAGKSVKDRTADTQTLIMLVGACVAKADELVVAISPAELSEIVEYGRILRGGSTSPQSTQVR